MKKLLTKTLTKPSNLRCLNRMHPQITDAHPSFCDWSGKVEDASGEDELGEVVGRIVHCGRTVDRCDQRHLRLLFIIVIRHQSAASVYELQH